MPVTTLIILAAAAAVVLVPIAGVMVYAATLPGDFQVSRSASIAAAPEKIYPLIDNFKRFNEWNPFAKQDPTIKFVYSGPEDGVGAANSWTSDGKAGVGQLMIVDAAAPSRVTMRLDFVKPMEAHNTVVFTLQPRGSTTEVSWSMSGKFPYVGKLMSVFFSMDKMVGGEFEKGLADLKRIAETQSSI